MPDSMRGARAVWMECLRVHKGASLWLPYVAKHAVDNLHKQVKLLRPLGADTANLELICRLSCFGGLWALS